MLFSPTEPAILRDLGLTSSVPEENGADILIPSPAFGLVGVQRKEFGDLVSSLQDGRLSEQLGKMASLDVAMVMIEGEPRWSAGGESVKYPGFTRNQMMAVMWSVQSRGIWITMTRDLQDTMEILGRLEVWLGKKHHHSLRTRASPSVKWGKPGNRDWGIHLWSSLPGIGGELAGRLYDRFGVPFQWRVGVDELCQVDGVGKKKAEKILSMFSPPTDGPTTPS